MKYLLCLPGRALSQRDPLISVYDIPVSSIENHRADFYHSQLSEVISVSCCHYMDLLSIALNCQVNRHLSQLERIYQGGIIVCHKKVVLRGTLLFT